MSPLSVRLLAIAEKHGLMYEELRTIDEALAALVVADCRESMARSVQARMRADGLLPPSPQSRRFHMKRSHVLACAACYVVAIAFLVYALVGPTVAQCIRWP